MALTWARLILCCIAVRVGLSHETLGPRYLHPVAEGTGDPFENSRGIARGFWEFPSAPSW